MSEGENSKGRGRWRARAVKGENKALGADQAMAYDEQLAMVLRTRNVFKFRYFLAASGRSLPVEMMLDVQKLETLLHQLTLSLPVLADLHEESRQWLTQNTVVQDSLNAAAKRVPGVPHTEDGVPAPQPGRRIINLRAVSNPPQTH